MRVTVVTTLYNYKRYIGPAIKSFLSQDIKDSEMIVVDDSSTDNPYSVLIRDSVVANGYGKHFELLWKTAKD